MKSAVLAIVFGCAAMAQPSGYTYGATFTVDHTKVGGSDLSNVPVLISGTFAEWKTVGNGGRVQHTASCGPNSVTFPTDLVATDDAGGSNPLLPMEPEFYVASTGETVAWVNVPAISHTVDTIIYLWYGNAAVSTCQTTEESAWTSAYKAVYLLPNGSSLNANDGTASAFNGTANGSVVAIAGKVDGGGSFPGGATDYIGVAANSINTAMAGVAGVSVSVWVKYSSLNGTGQFGNVLWAGKMFSPGNSGSWINIRADGGSSAKPQCGGRSTTADSFKSVTGATALSTNTFYHVTCVLDYSANTIKVYLNGVIDGTNASAGFGSATYSGGAGGAIPTVTDRIGDSSGAGNERPTGVIDEVMVIGAALSADQVTNLYANTSNPAVGGYYSAITFPGGGATVIRRRLIQ